MIEAALRDLRVPGALLDRPAALLAGRAFPLALAAAVAVPLLRLSSLDAAGLAVAALAGVALLLRLASMIHEGEERAWVGRAILVGLLLRVAFAVAVAAAGGFRDETLYYDPVARLAAEAGPAGAVAELARHPVLEGRWAYGSLLTGAYLALGADPASGRLLGILLGLGTALLAGEIARPLAGRRAAALAVAVLALHPEAALWTSCVTRDALSAFLVLAALAVAVRSEEGLLRGRLLLLLGPLALLGMNAPLPAFALATAILGALFLERGAVRIATAGLIAGTAFALCWPRIGIWIERLPEHPGGLASALLAPYPWEATTGSRAAYGALLIGGYAAAALGAAGLLAALRRDPRRAAAPALFALATVALLALAEDNAGTLARHRLPLASLLAAGAGAWLAGLSPAGSSPPRPSAPGPASPLPSAAS